jgi:oligopeptide transport system substrate-binding protein
MNRKPLMAGMAALLALSVLAGCSKPTENKGTTTTETPKTEKVLRYNAGSDFKSLDPAIMTDLVAFTAVNHLMEGLTRATKDGLKPALAAKWDILENGTKFVFTLRDGIKWSNGDPITAEDFVYAWQRALDPETASEYAYQLYYIKGGEKLNTIAKKDKDGKENPNYAKEIEEAKKALGVVAKDAKTLEVTLEAPTPYFLELTSFPTLLPVNKKVVSANKDWAAKPETYISSGPYKMEKWEAKSKLVMVKNPNYWNKDAVKIDKLEYSMIEEKATALQLWESGQLDVIDAVPGAETPRLVKEGKMKFAPSYSTYYYFLNTTKKPFDDPRVRKALAYAIDRKAITENVTKRGDKPAYALVPPGSMDPAAGKDFRDAGGDLFKEDVAAAQKLLADAGYPGGKGFPEVEFIYNTDETHKAIIEAILEMWKKNLGITSIKAVNMDWPTVLKRRQSGDYQMARGGWTGDYLDAMTFMDLYVTNGGNNDAKWSNKEVDELIKTAKSTGDQKVRMEAMHKAEKIYMDEMVIIPIFFRTNPYLDSPKVSGIYRNALGVTDFTYADIK